MAAITFQNYVSKLRTRRALRELEQDLFGEGHVWTEHIADEWWVEM